MMEPPVTEGDCFRTIEHDGTEILVVDFRHCTVKELARRAQAAAAVIRTSPERSVLSFANLHGTPYNKETMAVLRDYAMKNGPYVLAGAVVGLEHLSQVLAFFNRVTGRRIRSFDDEESAKSFLAAERRRLTAEATPPDPTPVPTHAPPHDHPVRWIEYDGERLLVLDLGNCDGPELRIRIQEAVSVIHREQPQTVIALNLLHNFPFGREAHAEIINFVKSNRPYVIAAAAVGLGYMKPAIPVLNRLTGRNIRAFDDAEPAMKWLVSEKRRILGA